MPDTLFYIVTFAFSLPRFCGGLIKDIKRKAPFFASDFYDALNIQALSAILFIYLATVTNAITFGGLLGDATDNMQVGLVLGKTQIVQPDCLPHPCSSARSRWPFSYSAWFSFFCWMVHFTLLLVCCCISSILVVTKIARWNLAWVTSGEKKGRKWGYIALFGQKQISCFNFVLGIRFWSSITLNVWTTLLNLIYQVLGECLVSFLLHVSRRWVFCSRMNLYLYGKNSALRIKATIWCSYSWICLSLSH